MEEVDYTGREAALVKHFVLEKYVEALAIKVGHYKHGTTLNYIDGFSGPWEAQRSDRGDCSPSIALKKLCGVRDLLAANGPPIAFRPRGLFVESDPAAFGRLVALLAGFADVETSAIHGEFEDHIGEAVKFAQSGKNPFAFTFIDPTGWTGLGLQAIAPLLRVKPGEVLINFMLKDILRFIETAGPALRATFDDLFGQRSDEYLGRWKGLTGLDREDAIVRAYSQRIRQAGEFPLAGSTIVLNPLKDRTHYHLIFATRSLHGLVAFREVERAAFPKMKQVRAEATLQHREERTGQAALFAADVMATTYADGLQTRYQAMARREVEAAVAPGSVVSYDELLGRALSFPVTSAPDVKAWLRELRAAGRIEYEGLDARARAPQIGKQHRIRGA